MKKLLKRTTIFSIIFIMIFFLVNNIIVKNTVIADSQHRTGTGSDSFSGVSVEYNVTVPYAYSAPTLTGFIIYPIDPGVLDPYNGIFCSQKGNNSFGPRYANGGIYSGRLGYYTSVLTNVTGDHYFENRTPYWVTSHPNKEAGVYAQAGLGPWTGLMNFYLSRGDADAHMGDTSWRPLVAAEAGGYEIDSNRRNYESTLSSTTDYKEDGGYGATAQPENTSFTTNWYYSGGGSTPFDCCQNTPATNKYISDGGMAFLLACYEKSAGRSYMVTNAGVTEAEPLQDAIWSWLGSPADTLGGKAFEDLAGKYDEYHENSEVPKVNVVPDTKVGTVYSGTNIKIGPFSMSDYYRAPSDVKAAFLNYDSSYIGDIIQVKAVWGKSGSEVGTTTEYDVATGLNHFDGAISPNATVSLVVSSSYMDSYDELLDLIFVYQRIHSSGQYASYSGHACTIKFIVENKVKGCNTYYCRCSECTHTQTGHGDTGNVHYHQCSSSACTYCVHGYDGGLHTTIQNCSYTGGSYQTSGNDVYRPIESSDTGYHKHDSSCPTHTHNDTCCGTPAHTHVDECYLDEDGIKQTEPQCGKTEHTHNTSSSSTKTCGNCRKIAGARDCSTPEHYSGLSGHGFGSCSTCWIKVHTHTNACYTCTSTPKNYCSHGYSGGDHSGTEKTGGNFTTGHAKCPNKTSCTHGYVNCKKFNWAQDGEINTITYQPSIHANGKLVEEKTEYKVKVRVPLYVKSNIYKYITKVEHTESASGTVTFSGGDSRKSKTVTEKQTDFLKAEVGDKVTYKLVVENNSDRFPMGVRLKDTLPPSGTWEFVSISGYETAIYVGGVSTGTAADLAGYIEVNAGQKQEITLVIRLLSDSNANTLYENKIEYVTKNSDNNNHVVVPSWTNGATNGEHKYGPVININESTNSSDSDFYKVKAYNVTVNKYITNVRHVATTPTSISTANPGTARKTLKDDNRSDLTQSTASGLKGPVPAELGDIVTYNIEIYNTNNNDQREDKTDTVIRTDSPYFEPDKIYVNLTDTLPAGGTFISAKINGIPISTDGITYTDIEVSAGGTTTIVVELQLLNATTNTLANTVTIDKVRNINRTAPPNSAAADKYCEIKGTLNQSSTTFRTSKDYCILKQYKVAIEKFIVNVEHVAEAGLVAETYGGATGDYSSRKRSETVTETWKENNFVKAEVGDRITYRVILYNTVTSGVFTVPSNDRTKEPYYSPDLTYVTISDEFPDGSTDRKISIVSASGTQTAHNLSDPILVPAGGTTTLEISCIVSANKVDDKNTVTITKIEDINRGAVTNANVTALNASPDGDKTSADWHRIKKYSVSVDKYITKISHTAVAQTKFDSTERKGQEDTTKEASPTQAEVGDTIIYTIDIYNTASSTPANIPDINRDDEPYYKPDKVYVDLYDELPPNVDFKGAKYESGATVTATTVAENSKYEFKNIEVPANGKVSIQITIVAHTATTNKLKNTVYVKDIKNINKKLVHKEDNASATDPKFNVNALKQSSDWYIFKQYDVSVEKYIIKVTHTAENITRYDQATARRGKPETDKEADPVPVEVGDTVYYKIEVSNTSSGGPTFITARDNSPYFKPDLIYVDLEDTLPKGFVVDSSYKELSNACAATSFDGNNIKNLLVPENGSSYIIIRGVANYESSSFNSYENNVKIKNVYDINRGSNATPATSSDKYYKVTTTLTTTQRDSSSDWYKFKYYDISVDKYITNVEHTAEVGTTAGIPAGFGGRNSMNETTKESKAVPIEVGDTVTYTIEVYNTTNVRPVDYANINRDGDPYRTPNKVYVNLVDTIPVNSRIATNASGGYEISLPSGTTYSVSGRNITIENLMVPENGKITFTIKVVAQYTASVPVPNLIDIKDIYNINKKLVDKEGGTSPADPKLNAAGHKDSSQDWYTFKKYDVSIEKYIYNVTHTAEAGVVADTYGGAAQEDLSRKNMTEAEKRANPVNIEVGDTVYYEIVIHNTENGSTEYTVPDRTAHPYYNTDKVYVDFEDTLPPNYRLVEAVELNGASNPIVSGRSMKINNLMIEAGGQRRIRFKLIAQYDANEPVENKAEIKEIRNINYGNGSNTIREEFVVTQLNQNKHIISCDYYKFKRYDVSIEKYIYNVTHTAEPGIVADTYGGAAQEDLSRKNMTEAEKKANPFYVEVGDTVYYEIVIHNTENGATEYTIPNRTAHPYYSPDKVYVDFEDTLPPNYRLVEAVELNGANNPIVSGRSMKINNLMIEAGGQRRIRFKLVAEYDANEPVENKAEVKEVRNINYGNGSNTIREEFVVTQLNQNKHIVSYDYYKFKRYDVSVEKYIWKIEHTGEKNADGTPIIRFGPNDTKRSIAGTASTSKAAIEGFKQSNPEPIEVGDRVYYKIVVSNTKSGRPYALDRGNDTYKNPDKVYVDLEDILPAKHLIPKIEEIGPALNADGSTHTGLGVNSTAASVSTSDGKAYINNFMVPANSTRYIVVSAVIPKDAADVNTVMVKEVRDINSGANASADPKICKVTPLNISTMTDSSDWFKFKHYDVSIEKYVLKVEHTGETNADGSAIVRYNNGDAERSIAGTGSTTKDAIENFKKNNPQPIEVGDRVYYKIVVSNTMTGRPYAIDRNASPYYTPNKVYVNFTDTLPDKARDIRFEEFEAVNGQGANIADHSEGSNNVVITDFMVPENSKRYVIISAVIPNDAGDVNTVTIDAVRDINRSPNETAVADRQCVVTEFNESKMTDSQDWIKFKHYNVSVEKYIYDVSHVVVERTAEGTSDNTKVADNSRSIQSTPSYTEGVKQGEPVPVEPGDKVYYKIIVSNTEDSGAFAVNRNASPYYTPDKVYVDLLDTLPNGTDYDSVILEEVGPVEKGSSFGAETYKHNTSLGANNKLAVSGGKFEIKGLMVPENGRRYIIVSAVMKRTASDATEVNKVDITAVRDINRGDKSTTDDKLCLVSTTETNKFLNDATQTTSRDWHKFKHYNITVRKYIIDVNHQHDEVSSALDNTLQETEERKSLTEAVKNSNPVYVEYGDEVTYKIQINNTNGAVDAGVNWEADPYYKPDDIYVDIEDYLPKGSSNVIIQNGDGSELGDESLYDNQTEGANGTKVIKSTEVHVPPHESVEIIVKFTVEDHTKELVVENAAKISRIQNINMCDDPDKCEVYTTQEGNKNDEDQLDYNEATYILSSDWYKLNDYNVKTDKYVYKYDEKMVKTNNDAGYTREDSIKGTNNILNVSRKALSDDNKKANPVSVEKGETIVYKIEIRNEATEVAGAINSGVKPATQIRPNITTDWLEKGLTLRTVKATIRNIEDDSVVENNLNVTYAVQGDTTEVDGRFLNKYFITIDKKFVVDPGQYLLIELTARVDMSNMYIPDIINKVDVKELGNINTDRQNSDIVRIVVNDDYNEDMKSRDGNLRIPEHTSSDFVRMKDLVISGKVWVDLNRDGFMNDKSSSAQDQELYGMNSDAMKKNLTVKLYRRVADREELVRTTKTDDNGFFTFAKNENLAFYPSQYTFTRADENSELENTFIEGATYQRVDKANNKDENGNYTAQSTYIDYYIEYEYDGMVFKSTIYAGTNNLNSDGSYKNNYLIDSNANEFTKKREEFNEKYEYISYNSTYSSVNGGESNKTSVLEFDKTGHVSQLIEKKDVQLNNQETRPMTARSFIGNFDAAYIKQCINLAKNSCGAAKWKQCSNHWKHWETLATLGIINPDDFPNTTEGRKAAQRYLTSIYNSIDSNDAELTQYLWLYKFDKTNDVKTKPETEYLKHINYGLILRENVDLSLSKDVYKVKLTINGEEMEYTFEENPEPGAYGINGDSQLNGNYIVDEAYNMELYQSDYEYRIEQYISKAVQEYKMYHEDKSPTELNVEVTFKILVTNKEITEDDGVILSGNKVRCPKCGEEYSGATTICPTCKVVLNSKLSVKVHEILDLYDENFISLDESGKVTKIPLKIKDENGYLIDTQLSTIEAWYKDEDKTKGTALTVSNSSRFAQKGNDFTGDGYNTLYISGMDTDEDFIDEDNDNPLVIYVKYVLDKHDSKVKVENPEFTGTVDGDGYTDIERALKIKDQKEKALSENEDIRRSARGTENIAQVHAYSVWYTADKKPASLVDMDSNAGNIGDTNGKSTESTTKTSADDEKYYEDNTYKTGIEITAKGTENPPEEIPNGTLDEVTRKMDGYVWDDAKSTSIGSGKNIQYIGNGMYKASDNANSNARRNLSAKENLGNNETKDKYIEGAKAEYVEVVKMPEKVKNGETYEPTGNAAYYEQILMPEKVTWNQEQNSRTGANGKYELKGFIPGNYIVRFTYGDTVEEGGSAAKSMQVYNGQDYKSVQYDPSRDKNYITPDSIIRDLENENVSDARDDEIRRLEVNSYSEIMFNEKAEILKGLAKGKVDDSDSTNTADDLKVLTDNTYMNAETREFIARVEKEETATKVVKYDRSRQYNFRNIDFGIEYRPENEVTLETSIDNIKIISSSKQTLVDLKIKTEYNYRKEDGTVVPIYHVIDGTNSTGIDYVQFISNTYEKFYDKKGIAGSDKTYHGGEDLYTELIQGISNLTMDSDILQGATIIITYKMTAENHSEVDRISKNLNSIRYYYNKATQDLISANNGKIAYVYSPVTKDVTSYNSIITAKANGGTEATYLASTTARNVMLIDYYNKDDKGGITADGDTVGVIYRNKLKTYSESSTAGYFGRYVGHTYYVGTYGTNSDMSLDTIAELKISKVLNYIDRNLEYVSDNFTTLENRLWMVTEEADKTAPEYKAEDDQLRKLVEKVRLNNSTNKVLKNSAGILYTKLALSFDDRNVDIGDPNESQSNAKVYNTSLSRFLEPKALYQGEENSRSKYAGYIYLPLSKVVSAESDTDELHFEDAAEIVEYVTLNGRRTNFEHTIGDLDTEKDLATVGPRNGTKEFVQASREVDSSVPESIYIIPPTGLDPTSRLVSDIVYTTAKVGVPVLGIVIVIILLVMLIAVIIRHKSKKKVIK